MAQPMSIIVAGSPTTASASEIDKDESATSVGRSPAAAPQGRQAGVPRTSPATFLEENGRPTPKTPRRCTPAFYGRVDWHSRSVHGQWML